MVENFSELGKAPEIRTRMRAIDKQIVRQIDREINRQTSKEEETALDVSFFFFFLISKASRQTADTEKPSGKLNRGNFLIEIEKVRITELNGASAKK